MTSFPEKAAFDVLAERWSHVTERGWVEEHDDKYQRDELALAAVAYAMPGWVRDLTLGSLALWKMIWPWNLSWWKPRTRREDLVRAAALLIAEIARIDREEARKAAFAPLVDAATKAETA